MKSALIFSLNAVLLNFKGQILISSKHKVTQSIKHFYKIIINKKINKKTYIKHILKQLIIRSMRYLTDLLTPQTNELHSARFTHLKPKTKHKFRFDGYPSRSFFLCHDFTAPEFPFVGKTSDPLQGFELPPPKL